MAYALLSELFRASQVTRSIRINRSQAIASALWDRNRDNENVRFSLYHEKRLCNAKVTSPSETILLFSYFAYLYCTVQFDLLFSLLSVTYIIAKISRLMIFD